MCIFNALWTISRPLIEMNAPDASMNAFGTCFTHGSVLTKEVRDRMRFENPGFHAAHIFRMDPSA